MKILFINSNRYKHPPVIPIAIEYLAGTKAIQPYRWLWVIAVFTGSVISLNIVWTFSDITNALMAVPNLIALLLLNKVIVKETKDYLWSGKIDD